MKIVKYTAGVLLILILGLLLISIGLGKRESRADTYPDINHDGVPIAPDSGEWISVPISEIPDAADARLFFTDLFKIADNEAFDNCVYTGTFETDTEKGFLKISLPEDLADTDGGLYIEIPDYIATVQIEPVKTALDAGSGPCLRSGIPWFEVTDVKTEESGYTVEVSIIGNAKRLPRAGTLIIDGNEYPGGDDLIYLNGSELPGKISFLFRTDRHTDIVREETVMVITEESVWNRGFVTCISSSGK